jgi:predicted TIM-barrel fold metal-dependent hydrolase
MYRADGPATLRSLGEVEFINGVAAIAASGLFGDTRACAGIVGGGIDLTLGEAVEDILKAHIQAGGGRYRGIRCADVVYDEDATILGSGNKPHRLLDPRFQSGVSRLDPLGLSLDVWLLEPQLPDLVELARTFPGTQIILNHVGSPMGVGRYSGNLQQRFPIWRESIRVLATCPNVAMKIGWLGNPLRGFDYGEGAVTSETLARHWTPYVETCVEAFGVDRCMFESNFPIDSATCSYAVLWNGYKRTVAGASADEKKALFHGTAARMYSL